MEDKVKVVFEVSKLPQDDLKNSSDWLKFVTNFINNANKNTDFYFIVDFKDENNSNLNQKLTKFKTDVLSILKKSEINFKVTTIYFGCCDNPNNLDDNYKIPFYDFVNDQQIDLTNQETLFFFSNFELSDFLVVNGFFSYFLNFNNIDIDEKRIKKILKEAMGEINLDNYQDTNYLSINYEFLTFLEKKA